MEADPLNTRSQRPIPEGGDSTVSLRNAKTNREKSDSRDDAGGEEGESGQINDGSITIEALSYLAAILAQYGPKSNVSRQRDIEWRRPYVAF